MPQPLQLAPHVRSRLHDCVHCGLCLATCPTYAELGDENDSPRGRLLLIRRLVEGTLPASPSVLVHLDRCLDCRACETVCPSGVKYGLLVENLRTAVIQACADPRPASWHRRLVDFFLYEMLPYRNRLAPLVTLGRIAQRLGLDRLMNRTLAPRLPADLRKLLSTLPPLGPRPADLPAVSPALGRRRGRVAFFVGCAAEALTPDTHRHTVQVLVRNGIEVLTPPDQVCCGAIHHHGGHTEEALRLAKRNLAVFEQVLRPVAEGGGGAEWLVNNIAGCGTMLQEYPDLFGSDPAWRERARRLAERTVDVHVYLARVGLDPLPGRLEQTVAYHEACHLAHGQKVTREPRKLLQAIPGLKLVDLYESDWCCGAAGSYNLTQPVLSARLAERKLECIAASGATTVAAANVGCILQLASYARAAGRELRVLHPMDLLAEAYAQAEPCPVPRT